MLSPLALDMVRDRIRAASGPDRALDRDIARAILNSNCIHARSGRDVRRYTSDLDEALTLVEKTFPGWIWDVGLENPVDHRCRLYWAQLYDPVNPLFDLYDAPARSNGRERSEFPGKTAPLAVLDALVSTFIFFEIRGKASNIWTSSHATGPDIRAMRDHLRLSSPTLAKMAGITRKQMTALEQSPAVGSGDAYERVIEIIVDLIEGSSFIHNR